MPTNERVNVLIDGMTCSHYEQTVRFVLEQVPGVHAVESVRFRARRARLLMEPSLAPNAITQALHEAGFSGHLEDLIRRERERS
jgi:copper chaperone CopZ